MKKMISLLLCVLMLASLLTAAFAVTPEDIPINPTDIPGDETESMSRPNPGSDPCDTNPHTHEFRVYNASCDGYFQTWWYMCKHCPETYSELHNCPRAGHGGSCNWLPA